MNVQIESTPLSVPPTRLAALTDRGIRIPEELREACLSSGGGAQQLERLFAPDALCVTTGQQPGLFLGPALALHKAMAAIALAARLEREWGRTVVPVFWVAGDDHDFLESNHFSLLNQQNAVEQITIRDRAADAPATPMYREMLGPDVDEVFSRVRALTPETEFRDAQFEWLGRHYRAGADFASAFAGAIAELLGPHGLVVFRSTAEPAKRAMAPLLLEALDSAPALDRALTAQARALEEEGRHPPVTVRPGNTLVMIEDTQGRDRLVLRDQHFQTRRSGTDWTIDDLARAATDAPQRLSPNVLLRPVVEAAILPTVAYVAGPGELAYYEQTQPVFAHLDVPPVPFVPRWSGRVVESRTRRILEKYHVEPDDLLLPEGQLEAQLVKEEMPESSTAAFTRLRGGIDEAFTQLTVDGIDIDPTLKKPIQSARATMHRTLADLEKRFVSHLKQNQETLVRQIAAARSALYPAHRPQERVINPLQFLVRHGAEYVDGIAEACRHWADELS